MNTRRSLGDARGAAYVEFLIAFLPVFLMFLALSQYCLLVLARLVLEHAAVAGARAAAVVIADRPEPGTLTASKEVDIESAVYLGLAPLIMNRYLGFIQVRYPATAATLAAAPTNRIEYFPRPAGGQFPAPGTDPRADMGHVDFVRVRVEADFLCRIAPVGSVVCGLGGFGVAPRKRIVAEASYPYQGARYELPALAKDGTL